MKLDKVLVLMTLAAAVAACTPVRTGSIAPGEDAGPPATAGHRDAPGSAPHSHDAPQAYGQPADPKKPARTVEIVMSETDDGRMIFTPDRVRTKAGEQILFKIRNAGELDHEFVLGTASANQKHSMEMQKNPHMEHDDPNAIRLAPGKSGVIAWKFTQSGEFEFACLIPGHRESGMIGLAAVR